MSANLPRRLLTALLLIHAGLAWAAKPTVVFVTKSDACSCQLSLCVAAEQEIRNFLADTGGALDLVTVDLAKTPEAGKTYKAFAVPVVILQDERGEAFARFYGYVEERHLLREWNEYLDRRGAQ
ncbi:thioredoxin domain-containing protein [Deferrisoma palaeochoriense]